MENNPPNPNAQHFFKEIERLAESIKNDESEVLRIIPEDIFVKYFIPYITGIEEENAEKLTPDHWITIAGSANKRIMVICENGNNFSIPGLFPTNLIDSTTQSEKEMGLLYNEYKNLLSMSVVAANSFLSKIYEGKFVDVIDKTKLNEYIDEWRTILNRYNIKFDMVKENEKTPPSKDEEYDLI